MIFAHAYTHSCQTLLTTAKSLVKASTGEGKITSGFFKCEKTGLSRVTGTKSEFHLPRGMRVFPHRHFLNRNMQGEFTSHSYWHLVLVQVYMSPGVQEEMENEILELFWLSSFPRDTFLQGPAKSEVAFPISDSYGSRGSSSSGSSS